ncbi:MULTISPECIES: helix-turn-helix domain-containing protein [Streptomyces]|uniref:Helix-turn-helix domain-containing protein n=1 Tax=Streptomyces ehimensis TaxID=68195 RepID=A0ABV9B9C1_9ACTN
MTASVPCQDATPRKNRPPLPRRWVPVGNAPAAHAAVRGSDADEILAEIVKDILEEVRQIQRSLNSPDAEEPLRRAEQINAQLQSLTAGLVGRARHRRVTWSRLGRLLNISEDTARHRYTDAYILRRLSQHIHMPAAPASLSALYGRPPAPGCPAPPPGSVDTPLSARTPDTPAFNRLAPVLSMLARASKLQLQVLAARAGCSASYLSRILSGERVPAWPLTERFAIACGADPAILRKVWESERLRDKEKVPAPVVTKPGEIITEPDRLFGPARLMSALRTLHIRAGQPAAYDIAVASRWRIPSDRITTILEGTQRPSWDELALLLHVLGGPLEHFRPLWEAATQHPDQPPPGADDEPLHEQAGSPGPQPDEAGNELHSVLAQFNDVLSNPALIGHQRAEHLRALLARRRGASAP